MQTPCVDPWECIPIALELWQETTREEPYLPFEIWGYRCRRCGDIHIAVIGDAELMSKAHDRSEELRRGLATQTAVVAPDEAASLGLDRLLTVLPQPTSATPRNTVARQCEIPVPEPVRILVQNTKNSDEQ